MKYHFFIGEKNWEKHLFLRYVCDCLLEKENWRMVNSLEEFRELEHSRDSQVDSDELILVNLEVAPSKDFGEEVHYFIMTHLAQDHLEKCKVAYDAVRERGEVHVILMNMPYGCKINGKYVMRFLEKGNKVKEQEKASLLKVYEIELDERDAKILIEDDHSSVRRPQKLSKGYQFALKEVVKAVTNKKFSKWPTMGRGSRNKKIQLHNAFGLFGMK